MTLMKVNVRTISVFISSRSPLILPAVASGSPTAGPGLRSRTRWKLSAADLPFSLLVAAALKDHREMKWYGVWHMALNDYLFRGCNTTTMACSAMPQYSLVATYDTYDDAASESDDEESVSVVSRDPSTAPVVQPPSRGPRFQVGSISSSPDPILLVPASRRTVSFAQAESALPVSRDLVSPKTPKTPSKTDSRTTVIPRRSTRVPDIVEVLHFAVSPFSDGTLPKLHAHRVILIVEIKPKFAINSVRAFEKIVDQAHAQARHAFREDESLKALGAIMAFGDRWRYSVIKRDNNGPRSWSEERDPTYHNSDDLPQFDPDSDDSEPETLELPNATVILPHQPDLPDQEFQLLDSEGIFMDAFQAIVENLKKINADIWK
ncbi:hypothetical protein BU15DRAFT_76284 [Melanogaster broomeanus]|nr:hypothetical protein BU15DRAFT_76284 [Melanogaster broomeanus]